MNMPRACHCTNQCRQCGACCAAGCIHRGAPGQIRPGTATQIEIGRTWRTQKPLTEEDVRRIAREEIRKERAARKIQKKRKD